MKSIISSLVLAAAALFVSSAQAGYGYGHHHYHTPVYHQPVIVKKIIIPVVPVYPSYNYNFCH